MGGRGGGRGGGWGGEVGIFVSTISWHNYCICYGQHCES